MRKTKRPPKATSPTGRVLRTGDEMAEWLFALDGRRKLARVARCEAECHVILAQPPTDPRQPYVARMQELLAAARSNLERGHPADWQMAEIERLGGAMNTLYLGRRLVPFVTKHPPGALRPALDRVVADQPTIHWLKAMSSVVPLLKRDGKDGEARIQARRLSYLDTDGERRTIGSAAFQGALSQAKKRLNSRTGSRGEGR